MRALMIIFGFVLILAAGGYWLAPEFYHGLLDEEVRGIRPATSVQVNAVRINLPHNARIHDVYTMRSDVHENAGLVAGRLQGRLDGQIGVWLLPGTSRGVTTVRNANDVARQVTPDLRFERVDRDQLRRLTRYVEQQ